MGEQAGSRPALMMLVDAFNHGPADLVVVLPVSSVAKGIPFHVPVSPPEGAVRQSSFIECEDVRSISRARLRERWETVGAQTIAAVEDRLRILIEAMNGTNAVATHLSRSGIPPLGR